jgi:hypothetical protein
MKFEHHKQEVISLKRFALRVLKYFMVSFSLIAISLLIGIAGYSYYGNLNLVDSFHMSSMILTGMGPVAEMKTESAKIFSSMYALYSGVIFLSIAAVLFAPFIHRILHILNVEEID